MTHMASVKDWIEGARLRTLPAALAPVVVGSAAAFHLGSWSAPRALLALGVALALQVGVNFANDYSDGVRGTDDHRSGPPRLTGGGLVTPKVVLAAAWGCFALAGVLGLVLLTLSGAWILLLAGMLAVLAAWFYTGGSHPYGYMGIGISELMVFVFFGLLATVGTTWTQAASAPWWVWCLASGMGLLSVDLLMANNLRDIPTDLESGKRTVAVRLGERGSRAAYALVLVGALALAVVSMPTTPTRVGVFVVGAAAAVVPARPVVTGATGRALIPALRDTGLYALVWAATVAVALVLASA